MDCPSCHTKVPANEIRAARMLARCPACDCTLELDEVGGELVVTSFREPPHPDGIRVDVDRTPTRQEGLSYRDAMTETEGEFEASWRWFTPMAIFLTLFALVWNAFLVTWYANIGSAPLIFYLFPLIHVAAGLGISWQALSMWINKTRVSVSKGKLKTTHGPIPALFDKAEEVALDDVAMFVSERQPSRNRKAIGMWQVSARLRNGRSVPVVTRVRTEEVAKFLQRRLERQLSAAPGTRVRVAEEQDELSGRVLDAKADAEQEAEFEA